MGHVEEGDPRLRAYTTGVYDVLLVVGSFEKDLAGGVRTTSSSPQADLPARATVPLRDRLRDGGGIRGRR